MQADKEILEIKKRLNEFEERLSKLEGSYKAEPKVMKKGVSINEFMRTQKTHGDVQKTLAVGYYLEKYEGLISFNAKDLESAFQRLKVPKSKTINFNYKAIKNIQQGYMTETKEKKDKQKAWIVTKPGEEYVERGFQKEK